MINEIIVVGALLGVLLQLSVGVWWWISAIALPVAVWLVFLSSIWWRRPGLVRMSLRTDLLTAIDPVRGMQARRREDRERIVAAGLPLFEIRDWPGSGALGGWGSSSSTAFHVSLAFADKPGTSAVVTVTVLGGESSRPDAVRSGLLGQLAASMTHSSIPPGGTPGQIRDAHIRTRGRLQAMTWGPSRLQIDGSDYQASCLVVDGWTATYCAIEAVWVTVLAVGTAHYALRTVTDPGRYLDQLV